MEGEGHFNPIPQKHLRKFFSSFEITNLQVNILGHTYVLLPTDMLRVSSFRPNCHKTKNLEDKAEATIALLDVGP